MMKLKTYFVSTRAILVPVSICCAIYSDRSETILAKQIALIQPMFSQMSSRRTVFLPRVNKGHLFYFIILIYGQFPVISVFLLIPAFLIDAVV